MSPAIPSIGLMSTLALLAGCTGHSSPPKPPPGFKDAVVAPSPSDRPVVVVATPRHTIRTADDWSLSETAADSLKRIGAPAVPALVEMLQDRDPAMRMKAARILAGIGPEATAAVSMLQTTTHDSDPEVRKWSLRALGQIGEAAGPAVPDVIQALREKENDPARRAPTTPLGPAQGT